MKIAIATFAELPNPPVKGGAVETLIDNICKINEIKNQLIIDVFSVYDDDAVLATKEYKNTRFIFYKKYKNRTVSKKNIIRKLFCKYIPDKTMNGIIRLINQNKYDYVIITSINYEMEYIFKKIKSRVIWYLHGDPISVIHAEAIKRIIDHCYAVFTVSDFVNRRVCSVSSKCRVITIRNCTDLKPIRYEEENIIRHQIRKKIEISDSDSLFVYIGRIIPIKGIYELVKAFVLADIPNAKLLIVGAPSGDEEVYYLEQVKSIDNKNIRYWGYAEHNSLNRLYCAADYIVAPSICQEAALLIALEASICNRLLITTNMGGIPEYVSENAILVEYNDTFIENLICALKNACNNKVNQQIINKNFNMVENYYDDFYAALKQIDKRSIGYVKNKQYN